MATKPKAPPKEKPLSCQEIEAIIRLCSQKGVTELNFGNLHLKFGVINQMENQPLPQATTDVEISETQHKEQTKQAIEQDEVALKEERLAFALIENPSLAEEMLDDGELLSDDQFDDGLNGESTGV
jgi:hypothetical protein